MNGQVEKWTNPSVKRLAGKEDPVRAITQRAREVVLAAMDKGWSGPPFDPLALSDYLNLRTAPRADIRDARTVPEGDGVCIEYNPSRSRVEFATPSPTRLPTRFFRTVRIRSVIESRDTR
jgi:hypothetical protein